MWLVQLWIVPVVLSFITRQNNKLSENNRQEKRHTVLENSSNFQAYANYLIHSNEENQGRKM